jgi:hypothetical protein
MKPKLTFTALLFIIFCFTFSSCKKESNNGANELYASDVSNSIDNIRDNLVAWYTFNGDDLDHSGNNNNVDVNTAVPAKGIWGKSNTAYYFNGINAYMTVPNSTSLNPMKQITLVALVKPTGFYQGLCHRNTILYKAYNDDTPGKYLLAFDDMAYYNFEGCEEPVQNKFENFYGSYGDGQATAAGARDTNTYIRPGWWYLVVYTYDGQYAKLYIDGKLVSTSETSTTFTPNDAPLYIGGELSEEFPYWFTGTIDEIRIYSKAITRQQILHLTQFLKSSKN